MINWRWDQGRLQYFSYNSLKLIAQSLVTLNGVSFLTNDPLRESLVTSTGLPFLPTHYSVWRNYSRIFKWTFLAARINNVLMITDVCRRVADTSEVGWGSDEFFSFLTPRLYLPSPATDAYNPNEKDIVFPFSTIIKYLCSCALSGKNPSISLQDIPLILIGNKCTGFEGVEYYAKLSRTNLPMSSDEMRQIREMVIFFSQWSILKWNNDTLYLENGSLNESDFLQLFYGVGPVSGPHRTSPDEEILRLGTLTESEITLLPNLKVESLDDQFFTEGRKIRSFHLRIERSPQLRRLYFSSKIPPYLCDLCSIDTKEKYPWTENILELHHLLPLSSSIQISSQGTSLSDLSPLCPNCHKSVHLFYKVWLSENKLADFVSRDQAIGVFAEIKKEFNQD